ncbi:hypothetical protein KKHLCK_07645 [Candidatus Electrothrix laxa]
MDIWIKRLRMQEALLEEKHNIAENKKHKKRYQFHSARLTFSKLLL